MPTKLTKAIEREIELKCAIKDRGRPKPLILMVSPEGWYTLRPKGTAKGGEAEVTGLFADDYNKKLYAKYR